jgi:outer membrane lipoprotein-sorting protein
MKGLILCTAIVFCHRPAMAQEAAVLLQNVKAKLEKVNDYSATGTMKTNVSFLKVPTSSVNIYFKKPNKVKIKSGKGVSFVPKGAININLNNLLAGSQYSVIDAGVEKAGATTLRIIKLLPTDEAAEVVLSTLYIDAANGVIQKAKTTTRDNGTYELEMTYGKYLAYGLPDKVLFSFNAREYKLPKGVTFDFDDGSKPAAAEAKNKKGSAEITFNSYTINKGVSDTVFQ